jgi:hypothetical protein
VPYRTAATTQVREVPNIHGSPCVQTNYCSITFDGRMHDVPKSMYIALMQQQTNGCEGHSQFLDWIVCTAGDCPSAAELIDPRA